jgi:multiple sugar transport system substrate-binding protein
MKQKRAILLLGLIIILSGWWITQGNSRVQPEAGVLDVWATWGEDPERLQAFFERYSQSSGVPIRVTTQVRSDVLIEALIAADQPDLVILSNADLVKSYDQQGLIEPLNGWIELTGIDLEDIYPAPLKLCQSPDGGYLCLPWGGDVEALFWNKDLFKAAGLDPERPPQTMEELVEYAGRLTRRDVDGELSQVGFIPDLPHSHAELYAGMFGTAFDHDDASGLVIDSQPLDDALNWQKQFYNFYTPEEIEDFVAAFTPYMTSSHPLYAERRMSCQQCHRSSAIQNKKIPARGFYEGRVVMVVDGQWLLGSKGLSHDQRQVNYGMAPFPTPADHPGRSNTVVVQGPVVIIPAGAVDKQAAAQLLAWMTSPEILAEAAYANSFLPTSRTAAQDARFQQVPNFEVFMDLLANTGSRNVLTTAVREDLNQALSHIEEALRR